MNPVEPPLTQNMKIPKVTAKMMMQIVEGLAIAESKGLTLADACKFGGISDVYAKRALDAIVLLQMGTLRGDRYFADAECNIVTKANSAQWPMIFRKFLQRFDPFILFIRLVGKGDIPGDAARKTSAIYSIESPVEIISSFLLGWGEYANILETGHKGRLKLKEVETVDADRLEAEQYLKELIQALESDFIARIYISGKLGDEAFAFVDHADVEFMVSAIREHAEDSRGAIENIGRAYEDFLRKVGTAKSSIIVKGQKISDCKGIGQLIDTLKVNGIIHEKHYDLSSYVNAMRLASAHGMEAATNLTWTIKPDAAIETILTALTGIRSIHSYVFKSLNLF